MDHGPIPRGHLGDVAKNPSVVCGKDLANALIPNLILLVRVILCVPSPRCHARAEGGRKHPLRIPRLIVKHNAPVSLKNKIMRYLV